MAGTARGYDLGGVFLILTSLGVVHLFYTVSWFDAEGLNIEVGDNK